MPDDPMSGLKESAIQLHELFESYKEAGFSEVLQAFDLVKTFFQESLRLNRPTA